MISGFQVKFILFLRGKNRLNFSCCCPDFGRKAIQEFGPNQEVLNILCQFIEASSNEIQVIAITVLDPHPDLHFHIFSWYLYFYSILSPGGDEIGCAPGMVTLIVKL